jgi:hypothetical protein
MQKHILWQMRKLRIGAPILLQVHQKYEGVAHGNVNSVKRNQPTKSILEAMKSEIQTDIRQGRDKDKRDRDIMEGLKSVEGLSKRMDKIEEKQGSNDNLL